MAGLIDVGILKPELAGAFGSGYRASEQNRMQSQQDAQALEMNRMKLEQLKQDKIALTQLQEQLRAAGKESDPNKIFDVMIGSGNPDLVAKGMEGKQRYKQLLAADELLRQYSPELYPQATTNPLGAGRAPTAAPAAPAVGMEPNALGSGVFGMNALAAGRAPEAEPAPTNQLAAPQEPDRIAALRADIVRLRSVNDPRTKALADVKQAQLNELLKVQSVSPGQSLVQGGRVVYTAPERTQNRADRFVPVGRLVFDRETQQFITPPAAAIAATREGSAGTSATGKPPSGYRFTQDGSLEPIPGGPAAQKPLSAAEETKRRDTISKEFKNATTALQTMQDVLDSADAVKTSPGLGRATGYTGVYLPSFSEGEAAKAETRLANLKGKVTALGKASAAMSGAIGSIATQEWKIIADQIAVIDPVKGKAPLLEQIALVEAQAQGAIDRIRDAYSRQFGEDFERFPQFKDIPAPKSTRASAKSQSSAPSGGLTPAEQKELEELRKRFPQRPQ